MEHDCDIAIVGGGFNGPALALAAAQVGLRVIVLDATSHKPRKNAKFDGRAYALALASKRLLAAVGVWENVAQDAEPMLNIRVSDGRAGVGASPFFMDFDHAELEEGPMGYMVEDRHLRYALQAAMQTSPLIEYRLATRVTGQSTGPEGVTLSLANNQKITTRLLVGADGRQSGTAARAGITYTGWQYGQTALVCAVEHDRPHGGVAHQFFMPAGPMAVLPLSARRSTVVWSEKTDSAAVIKTLDDAAFLDVLRPRFGDFPWRYCADGRTLQLSIGDDDCQKLYRAERGVDRGCGAWRSSDCRSGFERRAARCGGVDTGAIRSQATR